MKTICWCSQRLHHGAAREAASSTSVSLVRLSPAAHLASPSAPARRSSARFYPQQSCGLQVFVFPCGALALASSAGENRRESARSRVTRGLSLAGLSSRGSGEGSAAQDFLLEPECLPPLIPLGSSAGANSGALDGLLCTLTSLKVQRNRRNNVRHVDGLRHQSGHRSPKLIRQSVSFRRRTEPRDGLFLTYDSGLQ